MPVIDRMPENVERLAKAMNQAIEPLDPLASEVAVAAALVLVQAVRAAGSPIEAAEGALHEMWRAFDAVKQGAA